MITSSDIPHIPFVCDGGTGCCPLCHSEGDMARDPHIFMLPDGRRVKACCRAANQLVNENPGIVWVMPETF